MKCIYFLVGLIFSSAQLYGMEVKQVDLGIIPIGIIATRGVSHLNLSSVSKFFSTGKTYSSVSSFLIKDPEYCKSLSYVDHLKVLIHAAQKDNEILFKHMKTCEDAYKTRKRWKMLH